MVLKMEKAMTILPVVMRGRSSRKCDEKRKQVICERERMRIQQFKWKIEDSKKRRVEKGEKYSLMRRTHDNEDSKQGRISITEKAVPICPNLVTSEWKSVLRPISYHDQVNMVKSLKDVKIMSSNRQTQPLTTIYVRWQNNRDGFTYSLHHLEYIFSHFGSVLGVCPQSLCSAHVTFESIESACRAISVKNIGVERYPLHVCWLPKARQNRYWRKKEALPKTFIITKHQGNQIKRAISHPSQIHCTYQACSVKACPNRAVVV